MRRLAGRWRGIAKNSSMASDNNRGPRGMGITLRIALLSWLVSLATLLIFVLVTIPQQKRFFLENLESKAKSVSVSMHDVAAGAAINEDYASVVNAGQTLLEGDVALDFLIIMKNDRYALIFEERGWRVEDAIDAYWLPRDRKPAGAIERVPLMDRRVFHFAQPFDYSGIQWGWIHVGFSLKDYDRSVAVLYRNTILVALGCIVFSLLVSMGYARQIVRPILRLRHVVKQIAGGDLSVRAERVRNDELGSLARSVNTMTEALLHRDHILESVGFVAQQFMRSPQWKEAINRVLAKIGQAAGVSRTCIFENQTDEAGRFVASRCHEWTAPGVTLQVTGGDLRTLAYDDNGLAQWREPLSKNAIICTAISAMSAREHAFLEPQGVVSVMVIPIFVEGAWWGFFRFDDCFRERNWTDAEKDSLRAAADMLGATIARQQAQEGLLEAKATLEQRVMERTRELRKEIDAKEEALAQLAATQSSLIEMSRAAGMAEVATGVLHNVGNVLNSVNVSCTLLMDQLRQSRVKNVSGVARLMAGAGEDLGRFLTEDPRGSQIPAYLTSLASALETEREMMFGEAESLHSRMEHIKEIVSMQQSYGRVSGVDETIRSEQLMEDAVKFHAGALERDGVTVERQYEPTPMITVDKHKVLQILLNLIDNARQAYSDVVDREKTITLTLAAHGPDRIQMQVKDNGIGISVDHKTRIFQHGFTTRKSGHGFGLHSGALAARDLGGSLTAQSDGPGRGATFTLDLPCCPGEKP